MVWFFLFYEVLKTKQRRTMWLSLDVTFINLYVKSLGHSLMSVHKL